MLELIYYGLFLLLYGLGAWTFFNGLQDLITNASKASKPQPSASQFDIGNMKPGTVFCTANCLDDDGEIDSDVPSHGDPGVAEIAKAERLRIEQEVKWKMKES
jgi:hypothetical protein